LFFLHLDLCGMRQANKVTPQVSTSGRKVVRLKCGRIGL
jgi:hypothetical protein